jgi:putative aldouronate transport system permease protein
MDNSLYPISCARASAAALIAALWEGTAVTIFQRVRRDFVRNRYLPPPRVAGLVFRSSSVRADVHGHPIAFEVRVADGIFGSEWVGRRTSASSSAARIGSASPQYAVAESPLHGGNIVAGLLLAVFLNEIRHLLFKRITQSLVLLPYFVSWLVVAMMVFTLLNSNDGLINRTLERLGLAGIDWYTEPKYWRTILTLLNVWKWGGYTSIIYLAAVVSIEGEFFESARVDGASRFQLIWHITLPLLIPTPYSGLLSVGACSSAISE